MAKFKVTLLDSLSDAEPEIFEASKYVVNGDWVQMLDGYGEPITIIRASDVRRIDRLTA